MNIGKPLHATMVLWVCKDVLSGPDWVQWELRVHPLQRVMNLDICGIQEEFESWVWPKPSGIRVEKQSRFIGPRKAYTYPISETYEPTAAVFRLWWPQNLWVPVRNLLYTLYGWEGPL